jgi:hypothetical protein
MAGARTAFAAEKPWFRLIIGGRIMLVFLSGRQATGEPFDNTVGPAGGEGGAVGGVSGVVYWADYSFFFKH